MRASQEIRWKQRIKENEERRRRYEEASKRLEMEEKEKAQRALEERRAERARMDDLMRNPAQAPAPPKKPILRKGAGAVLRSPPRPVAGSRSSQRPATVPTQPSTAVSRSPSRSPVRAATACAERPRREWSEGLKQFIAGQREAAKPGLPQGMFPAVDDALSWQELKLAAEAGFEELIRMQEAAAAAAAQQPNPAWRRPGMTRATGGGGNTAEAWAGPAAQLGWPAQGLPADNPMQCSSPHTAEPPAAGNTANSASAGSNRPLVSKWVARMQQAKPACAPEPSCSEAQSLQAGNAAAAVQACAEQGVQEQQQQQVEQQPQLQLPDAASAQQASAAVAEEQLPAGSPQELRAVMEHPGVNSFCPAGQHINSMDCSGHDDKQHFTAAAAQAAAALRASMDQLHRSAQPAAADSTGSHTAVAGVEAEAAVGAAAALPESVPAAASDTLQVAFQAAVQPSRQHSSADEGNSSNCDSRQPRSSRAARQHSCRSSMASPRLPEAAVEPTDAELLMGQPGALLAAASGSAALLEQAAAADGTQTDSSRDMDEQGDQVQQSAPSPQAQALQVPFTCVATTAVEVPHGWSAECDQFDSPGASVCSQDPQAQSLEQQHCDQQTQQADGPAAAAAAAVSEQEWHEPWPRAQPLTQAEVAAASQQTGSPTPCAQVAAEDADVAACAAHAAAQHHQQQQQQEHQQQQQQPADNVGDVSASAAHSTTLDALLAEAKQLVALRRAVGAEFAAMGRSRVAAVMGAYEPDVQTLDDSGLDKAASAAVDNTQSLQAVQPLAQPQMSAVHQAQEHQSVCRTSVAAPARYAAAVQAEAQWAQGNSSPATVDDTAVAAPVAAGASQPRSQPAAPASLACEDPDLVPLRQLGQQHQSQMLQQQSVWLPVDMSQQQLERQAQEQAQQPEQQRSPRPSQQEPARQLGQPALSSGGSSQLALSPLQQDTGGSAAQGRQLCFTSNPLFQSLPPSPYHDPSTQQVMVQQQQVVQQQQQQQQVPQQMMYQQAAQHGAVQQAALQQAAADQQGHLEHLGPSEEQAQYQQQVLQDQHHQQHGLMHAQQLPLPVPTPKDAVEPAISQQQFSMQQQVQQQQQEQQQHHHRQQQQQQQEEWQQSQQQERARSLLHPRSAAGPRPCDEPCAGQSHHVAPGGAQQGYWPGPMVSQLQGRDAVPASLQHAQGAWGAAAGATGSSGLQAQHMWGVPPDAGYTHWDFQRDPAIHSEPMAVSAVLPGQYVHMQHAALGAADLAQMANVPQLHHQGAEWPANQYGAPPAALGWDAATAAEQVPSRVTSNAASALGADTAVQCVAEGAVAHGLDDPACSSSGSSGPAGSSRFLSKLASKVKSAVGRMAVGAAHHTPQQPQQQQQQGPGQLPPKSPRQPHAQHAGEQGSYVAAALLAQQRAEAEAAERERIKAAAEAAKQAAARKAAAERAEAQRKAAEQVAQSNKLVPVAIGSYARQQNASQQQQQQQPAQGTHHVASDTNQQLDSCGAELQMQRTARTQAVAPVLAAAQVPAVSPAKQTAGRQPCAPQAPPSPAGRNSCPRHRPVRTAGRSQVQQQAQAAAGGMSGCDAAGVLARAADQYALVSRIPGAPGTKPTTPPQLSNRNTAARDAPAGVGAQSTHRMHEHQPQHQHHQQQQQRQQQQQQQQQAPGASHCQADSDDDDFAHLERELQDDRAATAAAHAAVNKGPSYWGLHHADSVRDGYQQQQQQLMQQQQQQFKQQQQQMSGLSMVPGVAPMQAAWAPGMQESPRPQGMWAAVHAAAAAAAARGQQQDSAPAAGPVDHQPVQPQQQRDTRKAVPLSAGSHSHSSPAKLRPLATGAVPPSTRRATMPPLPAPEAAPSSSTVRAAPVVAAATAKQLVPAKAPDPAAGRAAAKQQRQQQPSRLSLEEANLLAELQQLDQRMHHTDQHRDAPPSTSKLPATTVAVGSPSKARGATAKAAAVAAKSPVRSAPMTAPVQRGGSSAVVKLAAIRGASRGSSASSSGCDVPPTSAHRQQQQQQQQQKASKQAKLVSVSRTAAVAADKTRTSSPQKTPPAISAAGPAGPAGPAFAPWGLPAGMQAQLDPRVGPQMPHGSTGMIPGAPMGPQGYWMGPGSGMMPMGQPGAVWPEGPTAGAAGAGAGQWQQQAALQRQQGPGGAWQGMQQPMWWPGQFLPQYAAGQPYTPPMQSGLQGGYGAYSAGNGGMMMQQQHRPGSGCMPHHMPGSCPPLTAPSGFGLPPGSPLLPTLHYQETVMRNRTSSSGSVHGYQDRAFDGSSGGGSRWGSAGSGSSGSSRGQQGDAGAGSGWASRVSHEAANVWPPRGVEKSILSGTTGARAAKGGGDGDIVVYNAHLLLS